ARMIAAHLSAEAGPTASDRLQRSYLLAAQAEVALAGDDLETAERAAAELEGVAAQYECDVLGGLSSTTSGAVARRRGRLAAARAARRQAGRLWQRARVPSESARSRALLGRALLAAGDEALGRLELAAARSELGRLGAAPDVAALDEVLSGSGEPRRPR